MRTLVLDFESWFSAEYSLTRMSTEEYVRHPEFKAHMVGIKWPGQPAANFFPDLLHTSTELRRQIETSALVAHHAHFDGLILSHHYNLKPAFWFDTLSMARATVRSLNVGGSLAKLVKHFGLPEKNVPYNLFKGLRTLPPDVYRQVALGCQLDVDLTWEIFTRLLPFVPKDELRVIDQVVRMFTEPTLTLDRPRLQAFLEAEQKRKADLMFEVGATLGIPERLGDVDYLVAVETELQSSVKFKDALEALGYECPMKWSEKATTRCKECNGHGDLNIADATFIDCPVCGATGKTKGGYIPALAKTDDGMKELLEHDDGRVSALAAARLGVKSTIDETRAERLLHSGSRGALPVYLAYGAAKTLRFGGGDKTNWQNFRRGGEIRKSIQAPEGYKLVVVDAAQVECRGLNWLAGEQWVLDAFAAGRDIYCESASAFYGRAITKDDKHERFLFKTNELGCGYGLGWRKYQRVLRQGALGGPSVVLTDDQAQQGINHYRGRHPRVVAMWRTFGDRLLPALAAGTDCTYGCLEISDHLIILPNGSSLDYEGMYWGYYEPDQPQPLEEPQWWVPSRKGRVKYYGGKLVENVVQALFSGLLIREAMVRIGERYRVVLQVHDELVLVVPEAEAETALVFGIAEMKRTPTWAPGLPLHAEGVHSRIYDK